MSKGREHFCVRDIRRDMKNNSDPERLPVMKKIIPLEFFAVYKLFMLACILLFLMVSGLSTAALPVYNPVITEPVSSTNLNIPAISGEIQSSIGSTIVREPVVSGINSSKNSPVSSLSTQSTVIDKNGYISSSEYTCPVASFTCTPKIGGVPLTVQFTDSSTNSPNGWAWYFGDEDWYFGGDDWTELEWTRMNASTGWDTRLGHSSVTLPDGSIVMIGGLNAGLTVKNDVWRSTDKGATWTKMNESPGWSGGYGHTSIVQSDGSIIFMGGSDINKCYNDVWKSTNQGKTWIQINASAGWPARCGYSSVTLPDGSIVIMGGSGSFFGGSYFNDVWLSKNNGKSWRLMNASAGWSARNGHSSITMADGSIILTGGKSGSNSFNNDTWRSTDQGATWTRISNGAGWSGRCMHSSVAMADGSIILMGGGLGVSESTAYNDIWRSTDNGLTWGQMGQMTVTDGWPARYGHSSVALPDGSIVLIGGYGEYIFYNDVWRLSTAGSNVENPSHIFTSLGSYNITLQAYNSGGFDSIQKNGYITGLDPSQVLTVTNITPPSAPDSGPVRMISISGTNFKTGAGVHLTRTGYENIPATDVAVPSLTQISCTLPLTGATAGRWNVVVTTPDGQSAMLENGFTILSNTPSLPTITSISPLSGQKGGTYTVTIIGNNFETGKSTVSVSGTGVTVSTYKARTTKKIVALISIKTGAKAGTRVVKVTNPTGNATVTKKFTITAGPIISKILPASGKKGNKYTVTITGTNFEPRKSTVSVSGTGVTVSKYVTRTAKKIVALFTIGTKATSGARIVTVKNPVKGGTVTGTFTIAGPTIKKISPGSGVKGKKYTVTITGTNFEKGKSIVTISGTGVRIGAYKTRTASKIVVPFTITKGATAGVRTITVKNPKSGETAVGKFTIKTVTTSPASINNTDQVTGMQRPVVLAMSIPEITETSKKSHTSSTTITPPAMSGIAGVLATP